MIDLVEYQCTEKPSRCIVGNAALWKGRLSVTPEWVEPVEWRPDGLVIRTRDAKPCRQLTVTAVLSTRTVTAVLENAPNRSPSCGEPMVKPEFSRLE
jgi:hypothetical protein